MGLGFRISGLGFRGLGFRGLGFRDSGLRVSGFGSWWHPKSSMLCAQTAPSARRARRTGVPTSQMGRCLPYDKGSRRQLMRCGKQVGLKVWLQVWGSFWSSEKNRQKRSYHAQIIKLRCLSTRNGDDANRLQLSRCDKAMSGDKGRIKP